MPSTIHLHGSKTKLYDTLVTLEPYIAESPAPYSVVVCPGGSYNWLAYEEEGTHVARWLKQHGISAFVLRYRTAGWFAWFTCYRLLLRGNRCPDAWRDGQMALNYLRHNAGQLGLNPDKIGFLGFSAGGHLALSQLMVPKGEKTDSYRKPAFVAAIYPVVTMMKPYVHRRSRRGLMGEWLALNRRARESWSVERHLTADCPPIFTVACDDDPVVDCRNALLVHQSLDKLSVPHRYYSYATGGHGFGTSNIKGSPECRQWKKEFLQWIASINQ